MPATSAQTTLPATKLPGAAGLPYVGESLALFSDPVAFVASHRQRYGDIFQARLMRRPVVIAPGAEAQRLALVAGSAGATPSFSTGAGYSRLEPLLGVSLLQLDGDPHQRQRKAVTPAFQAHNFGDYVARINRAYDRVVGAWPRNGTRSFYEDAHAMALRISTSLIIGVEDDAEVRILTRLLDTLFDGTATALRLDIPVTRFGRALQAKRAVDERLRAIVAQHRAQPSGDVLSMFIGACDDDGQPLSDEQLMAHLRLMLFAGYDTSTAVMSWGLLELLRHPETLERVRAEVGADGAPSNAPVTMDEMRQMPYLDAVIKETLRLHPATAMLIRGLEEPLELGGYEIPAGWMLLLPIAYTHRMAEYFAEPERFDPNRFLAPREEDKKNPYAWMGFGGGRHICLGMGIAQLEIKVVLTRLLRQFDLRLPPNPDMRAQFVPVNRPRSGAPVSFTRR